MSAGFDKRAEELNTEHALAGRRRRWTGLLAMLVALATLYGLLLPAFTMQKTAHCGMKEHAHTDACYALVCGMEESGEHRHTADCRGTELICGQTEHLHTLQCYSDPNADLETEADWKRSFPTFTDESAAERVSMIARSQLGCQESAANYRADGESVHGWTRYGAWNGTPYDDWGAFFAAFCLYYADVSKTDMPFGTGCAGWIEALTKAELYVSGEALTSYTPVPGELVFFRTDELDTRAYVAVVTDVDGQTGRITAVEGDAADAVRERRLEAGDRRILGFGRLPERYYEKTEAAPSMTETAALYPAQTFRAETNGLTVFAEADAGAFPEHTTMTARLVPNERVLDAVEGAVEGRVVWMQAVDITFRDASGKELQPLQPIRVSIRSDQIERMDSASGTEIVHVDDAGEAQLLEQKTAAEVASQKEIAFEADSFSIYAVVGTIIEARVLAGDGSSYAITVSCPPDAGVPKDAVLAVREIDPQTDPTDYSDYSARAAEAVGRRPETCSDVRLFDIKLLDASGAEIEIAAPVTVTINLTERDSDRDPLIVHFGEETEIVGGVQTDGTVVSFPASGFSVYAVVTPGVKQLDGLTFGMVFPSGGGASGCSPTAETAEVTVSGSQVPGLKGQPLVYRIETITQTDTVYVAKNSSVLMWTFHGVANDSGDKYKYRISTEVEGAVKYLRISPEDGVTLVDADQVDDCCTFTVESGTDNNAGQFCLRYYDGTRHGLTLSGSNFYAKTGSSGSWFYLAELSNLTDDDFVPYTADKVSISGTLDETGNPDYDVEDGEEVIVYTRVWDDAQKRYRYFIIGPEGNLVEAYDNGGSISWVGSKVNTMLWQFTEYHNADGTLNYYYELQNVYSGKYLAPQVSGGSFFSDVPIGVNLNGRRSMEYYSTVLAWDDPYYDYASLHVDEATRQLSSAPIGEASTFYFARMKTGTTEHLTQVNTLYNNQYGITVKMQDFNGASTNSTSSEMVAVLGQNNFDANYENPGLLKRNITGDYPDTTAKAGTGKNLGDLFSDPLTVNHQFLSTTYQETGYFEYDSCQNFAHLISRADDPWIGQPRPDGDTYQIGDFVVYEQLGTTNEPNKSTLKHGQFLPYNDLREGKNSEMYVNEMDMHTSTTKDVPLSDLDPRKNEKLYEIKFKRDNDNPVDPTTGTASISDFFFGMELSASFMQTENGKDAWGHDLIFEFSGDDDFWLYIDDKLVIDLGGVHSSLDGSVNFRTGEVIVNPKPTWKDKTVKLQYTLREYYEMALQEQGLPQAEIDAQLSEIFEGDTSVFKNYTAHTMRVFYTERGAGASNLHRRFNLAPYEQGEVLLEKEVSGTDGVDQSLRFPFQLYYRDPAWPSDRFERAVSDAVDAQTGETIPCLPTYTANGISYENVYLLKPGQTISIKLPREDIEYYIQECAMDTSTYSQVTANGQTIDGTELSGGQDLKDFAIAPTAVSNRKKVIFDNRVADHALNSLLITKRLWQEDEKQHAITDDPQEFRYRVYIGQDNGSYTVYNTGKYHVIGPDGCYCIYRNGRFESTHKSDLNELSMELMPGAWKSELDMATFHSSPGGAIDKIPAGFTVEIPNLMNGTAFLVLEREDEIPSGYHLIDYTREPEATPPAEPANEGVLDGAPEHVVVNNQHGYGLVVNKIWSDGPFMTDHDPIFFGVFHLNAQNEPELRPGTVRQLGRTETSLRWFFPELDPGKNLNDYLVYEVTLTPNLYTVDDATGEVTLLDGCVVTPIGQNGTITVGGKSNEHGYSANYDYTASYDRHLLTAEQLTADVNSREDDVTNARPGIKLVKTDLLGHALEGGVFTLVKDGAPDTLKTFTSGSDGLIAVAYLTANETYTLTEVSAPYRYLRLIEPLQIRVVQENNVTRVLVNGSEVGESGLYDVDQVAEPTAENMPTITIKNRPFTLRAVKQDAVSGGAVAGAAFAVFREVVDYEGYPMPDYTPVPGFERVVTDAQGVIPNVDLNHLRVGVWYLRELQAASGYRRLDYDVRLIIEPTGEIRAEKAVYHTETGKWGFQPLPDAVQMDAGGNVTLEIPNEPYKGVRILKKGLDTGDALQGAGFALYRLDQIDLSTGRPKSNARPIVSGVTDAGGFLDLGSLLTDTYYLYETHPPGDYNPLTAPVVISRSSTGALTATLNGQPLWVEVVPENNMEIGQITVGTSKGYELPATGGAGVNLLYTIGGAMMLVSGVLYLCGMRRKREGRYNE